MRFHFFFFNDTATTEIYTLSLHDALPISDAASRRTRCTCRRTGRRRSTYVPIWRFFYTCTRSEEHTSELQSHSDLVCRLLLEKKKQVLVPVGKGLPHGAIQNLAAYDTSHA